MKKNFFKKLAFVLAMAMVVTTLSPMANASAAAKPALAKRYTNVYEGTGYTYTMKNVKKGYTVKWAVSGAGAKYVNLSKKSTKATGTTVSTKLTIATNAAMAAKNAKVAVTATVYDAKGKRVIGQKNTVTLKVNAKALSIKAAAGVDAAGLAVDTAYKFNRVITPANATSVTYWTVTNKDGSATDKATIDAKGNFKATAEGEYTIKAEAKNAKNGVVKASATLDVTVGKALLSAKQAASNKVELVFNTNMKDVLKTTDLTMYANDSIQSSVAVNELAFSEDGKTVTAETFADFKDGQSYTVVYNKVAKTFDASIGSVASIELSKMQVEAGVDTDITAVFKNAAGVDISSTVASGGYTIEVETTDGYYSLNAGTLSLNILEKGKTAKVTVTLLATEWDEYGKGTNELKKEFTVTAVEKSLVTTKDVKFTLTSGAYSDVDWSKELNSKLSKDDRTMNLWINSKKASDNTVLNNDDGSLGTLTYKSSNNNVVIVNGNQITPVGEGKAYIIVEKDATSDSAKIHWEFAVTVHEAAKATTVTAEKDTMTVSNVENDATNKFTVKDQLGREVEITSFTIELVSVPNNGAMAVALQAPSTNVAVFSTNGAVPGTYRARVTAVTAIGDLTRLITIVVQQPDASAVESFDLVLSTDKVDSLVTSATTAAIDVTATITQKFGGVVSQTGLAPNSTKVTKSGSNDVITTSSTIEVVGKSGSTFTKTLSAGTYKVEAEYRGKKFVKYFTVVDTQPSTSAKVTTKTITWNTSDVQTLNDAITVKYGDTPVSITGYTARTGMTVTNATKTVYIESVTIRVTLGGNTLNLEVPVNDSFSIKAN